MSRLHRIMQVLAALVLLMSLGGAPVVNALTHGPGTLVAEADHAAWHAAQGDLWQADDHQHHDASDHDHSKPAILADITATKVAFPATLLRPSLQRMSGVTVEGLRRPPRQSGSAC